MSDDDKFDYNPSGGSLVFTVVYIWSALNYNTVFGWAYGVEGPFSQLAVWLAWTVIAFGVFDIIALLLIALAIVFGGLWILAGKTA